MSVKLEGALSGENSFLLNGLVYRRGLYEPFYINKKNISKTQFDENQIQIGLKNKNTSEQIQEPLKVSSWFNSSGNSYTSLNSLIDDITELVYEESTSSSSDNGITQNVLNYSSLSPGDQVNSLAYVRESQGTKWLPGSIGGTYYPEGFYIWTGSNWASDRNDISKQLQDTVLENTIVVKQNNVSTTLGGIIDSSKQYVIDGSIDMSGVTITVPSGGIFLKGSNLDLSELTCSDSNYTMFTGATAGNVFIQDISLECSGASSQVFDLTDGTGFSAVEFVRVNFNNCTAIGEISGYRQGLETGTGRFGGTPEMTLSGTWLGGYFIDTSIVRGLTDGGYSLYKAGTNFLMNSRFRTNQNIDLPSNASFFNFSPSNFSNPSTVQVTGALVSRSGTFNSGDNNLTPNITQADLVSSWSNNIGMPNTFEGGRLTVSSENLTNIAAGSTWYTLNGIWTSSNLEHFDSPSSGQLRHLGTSPREYKCTVNFVIESLASNDLGIRLRKWDDSTSSFVDFTERRREVNSLVGGRDVAIFNFSFNVSLDQNDYIFFQVRNNSGNNNLTLELDSDFVIEER